MEKFEPKSDNTICDKKRVYHCDWCKSAISKTGADA